MSARTWILIAALGATTVAAGPAAAGTRSSRRATTEPSIHVDLPGVGPRTYRVPTRFHQVEMLAARFRVKTRGLRGQLPKGLKPVSFLGRTSARVTVQNLGAPEEFAPYDEASLSVRVRTEDGGKAWHTLDPMPVTSFENRQRGLHLLGYPKELADVSDVSIEGSDGERIGRVDVTPRGAEAAAARVPLFTLRAGRGLTLPFRLRFRNHNLQERTDLLMTLPGSAPGDLLALDSSIVGRLTLGRGSLEIGEELARRYPGLVPARPRVGLVQRLSGADLELGLPTVAARAPR